MIKHCNQWCQRNLYELPTLSASPEDRESESWFYVMEEQLRLFEGVTKVSIKKCIHLNGKENPRTNAIHINLYFNFMHVYAHKNI